MQNDFTKYLDQTFKKEDVDTNLPEGYLERLEESVLAQVSNTSSSRSSRLVWLPISIAASILIAIGVYWNPKGGIKENEAIALQEYLISSEEEYDLLLETIDDTDLDEILLDLWSDEDLSSITNYLETE